MKHIVKKLFLIVIYVLGVLLVFPLLAWLFTKVASQINKEQLTIRERYAMWFSPLVMPACIALYIGYGIFSSNLAHVTNITDPDFFLVLFVTPLAYMFMFFVTVTPVSYVAWLILGFPFFLLMRKLKLINVFMMIYGIAAFALAIWIILFWSNPNGHFNLRQ